jgi:hypothetical protein
MMESVAKRTEAVRTNAALVTVAMVLLMEEGRFPPVTRRARIAALRLIKQIDSACIDVRH